VTITERKLCGFLATDQAWHETTLQQVILADIIDQG